MKQFIEKYIPTVCIVLAMISFWTPLFEVINEYEFTGFDLIRGVDIGYGYVLEKNYAFILLLAFPFLGAGLLYLIRETKVCMAVSALLGFVSIISVVALAAYQRHIMGQYMALQFGFWVMFFFFGCWCITSLIVAIKIIKNESSELKAPILVEVDKAEAFIPQKNIEATKKKHKTKSTIEAKVETEKQELSSIQLLEEDDRTVSIANDLNKQNMIIEVLGDGFSKAMKLEKFPCSIGSNKNEDNVYFADCKLSPSHMVLFFEEGQFQVVDNESKNGTQLNGRNIGKTFNSIKMGDILEAGTLKIVIKQVG